MIDSQLKSCIIEHEGIKKSVYKDSLGYDTIGIGFCCDVRLNAGLSVEECLLILNSRLANLEQQLSKYSWFTNQDDVRQGVLIELAYNMGIEGLLKFQHFLDAMQNRQPGMAAKELLNSEWAKQVGKLRLNNILNRVRYGRY